MSKKRTIDAFFGIPQAKKPRDAGTVTLSSLPTSPALKSETDNQSSSKITDFSSTNEEKLKYTKHASYPFPIPHLPDGLEAEVSCEPERPGRVMNDQPDLDLLYFDPYIPRHAGKQLFAFLRAELPFYRVEYDIARGPTKTHIRTPRWTTVFGLDDTARFEPSCSSETTPPSDGSHMPTEKVVDAQTGKPIPVSQAESPGPKKQPGYKATPRPIPHCLDVLRKSTEAATGCQFNVCLVNYYASGADSISYHSDDERFLGALPTIASFSLGAARDFVMKHKPPKTELGETATTNNNNNANEKPKPPLKLPLLTGDMVLMRGTTQANWLHSIPKRSGRNECDGGRINITFRRALVKGGTENYYQYNVGSGPVYKWDAAAREMRPWIQAPA
ncbi:hypothetical protein F4808DRAFT_336763 [Astrocystis sublimbata]|nr:hypothetical protein F4808DRAFT_336763 [Astrocystis sublimbata]